MSDKSTLLPPEVSPTGRPDVPQWLVTVSLYVVAVAAAAEEVLPAEHWAAAAATIVLKAGIILGIASQGKRSLR